jgi:hypothetical protein
VIRLLLDDAVDRVALDDEKEIRRELQRAFARLLSGSPCSSTRITSSRTLRPRPHSPRTGKSSRAAACA